MPLMDDQGGNRKRGGGDMSVLLMRVTSTTSLWVLVGVSLGLAILGWADAGVLSTAAAIGAKTILVIVLIIGAMTFRRNNVHDQRLRSGAGPPRHLLNTVLVAVALGTIVSLVAVSLTLWTGPTAATVAAVVGSFGVGAWVVVRSLPHVAPNVTKRRILVSSSIIFTFLIVVTYYIVSRS